MDTNSKFRFLALSKIAENILEAEINKQFPDKKLDYKNAGISLSYPGTQIIWPGPEAISSSGGFNVLFFFRGGSSDIMNQSKTNAITVLCNVEGLSQEMKKNFGNADFINNVVGSITEQLKKKTNRTDIHLEKLGLVGWSAGYNSIHGILEEKGKLKNPISYVGVMDGIHHGKAGQPDEKAMQPWNQLAEEASKGKGPDFVIAHSAIKPGSYASSTDSADYLLGKNQMQRKKIENWKGKSKVKPVSMAEKNKFKVVQMYDKEDSDLKQQHLNTRDAAADLLPEWK